MNLLFSWQLRFRLTRSYGPLIKSGPLRGLSGTAPCESSGKETAQTALRRYRRTGGLNSGRGRKRTDMGGRQPSQYAAKSTMVAGKTNSRLSRGFSYFVAKHGDTLPPSPFSCPRSYLSSRIGLSQTDAPRVARSAAVGFSVAHVSLFVQPNLRNPSTALRTASTVEFFRSR